MLTDHTYSGNADQYLPSVTLNDCISACIDSVGFICRLIHYFAYTCYLHSLEQQSATSISSMTTSAVGNTVLERDCAIPAPSIGISCVADTDCWETDSMCNQGFCECRNGYSYDFEHQRCAPGMFRQLSSTRLPRFQKRNYIEIDYSQIFLYSVCPNLCQDSLVFWEPCCCVI